MAGLWRDWRGPGHVWIQTSEGWIKASPLHVTLNPEGTSEVMPGNHGNQAVVKVHSNENQPHVFVRRNLQYSMSESFKKLAMAEAARDVPRFGYVLKLSEILFKTKLSDLSGTTQRLLFGILSQLVTHAMVTETNLNEAKQLVKDVSNALEMGSHSNHYGGKKLWHGHMAAVEDMKNTLDYFQLTIREDDDGELTLSDMPEECILRIMSAFTDYKDILNVGTCDSYFKRLSGDWQIWRKLCLFHFSSKQIESMGISDGTLGDYSAEDIHILHKRLIKKFGEKETYGETLALCNNCSALFWSGRGHPCLVPDAQPSSIPITPSECLKYFSG